MSTARPVSTRLSQFGRGVLEQTLLGPVREGRLRDERWPYGLRAAVVAGYLAFVVAAALVVGSGRVREHAQLNLAGSFNVGLPDPAVWILLTLFSFGLSLLLVAALHAPWWLRLLALLMVLTTVAGWAVRTPGTAGSLVWPALVAVIVVALVVLVVVRGRRPFAWWELGVVWVLVGGALVVGLVESRYAQQFGYDLVPVTLQYTASFLGYLVLPTALLAGASVAEVCVRLTASATEQAQRLSRRWVPYAVLGVVLGLRVVQVLRQLAGRDPVTDGWSKAWPALALLALFAGVGAVMLRLGARHEAGGASVHVPDLGEELGRVGLPIGAALIALSLPVQLLTGLIPVVLSLAPDGPLARSSVDYAAIVSRLVDPIRALLAVVLLVLAVRAARRGQVTRALVLGCVGVMLLALARALFLGADRTVAIDQDAVNLVATAVVVVAGVADLLRRRLTRSRALALAGALIISALFSSRDFISDPVGALLGFSGAALVLFGLTWDLLTGSSWGNGDSRRFPRPTRVLLVLANSVTTMSVLAFAALVRDGSTTIYLDPYAGLGDFLFGTALLAAAVLALLAPGRRPGIAGRPSRNVSDV